MFHHALVRSLMPVALACAVAAGCKQAAVLPSAALSSTAQSDPIEVAIADSSAATAVAADKVQRDSALPVRQVAYQTPATAPATSMADAPPAPSPTSLPVTLAEIRQMAMTSNKSIAVLGYTPAQAATYIDQNWAVFDPEVGFNAIGGKSFLQTRDTIQTLGAPVNYQRTDFFDPMDLSNVYIAQKLTTGGKVAIGYGADYLNQEPVGDFSTLNPSWESQLNLTVDQPLFRGRGKAVNEAPIAIAQATTNSSSWVFRAMVHALLRDVDLTYWEARQVYRDLEIQSESLARAARSLDMARGRLKLGEGSVLEVSQAEETYEAFRINQIIAQNRVKLAQYRLKQIIGLSPDDPRELVPQDQPTLEPVDEDWDAGASRALTRPEVTAQRALVQAASSNLLMARNGKAPDVSAYFNGYLDGLEHDLDSSIGTMFSGDYGQWAVGLRYRHMWGQRAEQAVLRRAELVYCQEQAKLVEIEHNIRYQVAAAREDLKTAEESLAGERRRSQAAAEYVKACDEMFRQGRISMDQYLRSEVSYATAMISQNTALLTYQRTLVTWQFATGAIMDGNVTVVEPPKKPETVPSPPPNVPAPAPVKPPANPQVQAPLPTDEQWATRRTALRPAGW